MSIQMQIEFKFELASSVPETAKQEVEACGPISWQWVEASVWTERMLAALGNGVKGGKWYSLIDKVYNRRTLKAAWKKVAANRGAVGVDKISIKRPGSGRTGRDHRQWPNAFFAERGLFTMYKAHILARQSR